MTIEISAHFTFELDGPTDILLQYEAADIPEQSVLWTDSRIDKSDYFARVAAQDEIGTRIWLRKEGHCEVDYKARIAIHRLTADLSALPAMQQHELPGETVQYLFDSRYCPAERFHSFVQEEFGTIEGGAKIVAMRDWVADHMSYEPGSSHSNTTALDSFVERRGICRDYAHVIVTMARAAGIPARYVSVYAPDVAPPDFHAIAEVFLADPDGSGRGTWHMVDGTFMADPEHTVKIGVGRDAADVSFLTSFGACDFREKTVRTEIVSD
ncbi:transglutaminase family protein [Altericroceibacterium spongiae]|uniref:Transglutaminase family protein n=2 Tax=Altericroceibacterium spongiae TaxID=2320269 RepID=A0A420EKN9_9SPHN|nr:transglutaminase family protein [Altericroceibacterium spongiae]